eukprot:CAMPEP_0201585940 /NCGR_PEP_ID=MMETSP0190_2-20130828/127170_1 /ASSEMBLY_ACC=CAM_ASM_000263 /TAXON_ID=37353 /ORGANISM="Rosalina sp." /LENGTH=71 /DNA_ID=CAMNT_0048032823 /DNA_START=152 /DNA_END=363 /DNA_ORIENTATION=-
MSQTSQVDIRSNIKKKTVMDKVPKDRGYITHVTIRISEERLFEECEQAVPDLESPGIPVPIADGSDIAEET